MPEHQVGKVHSSTGAHYQIRPQYHRNVAFFEVGCVGIDGKVELTMITNSIWEAIHLGELFLESKEQFETTTARAISA